MKLKSKSVRAILFPALILLMMLAAFPVKVNASTTVTFYSTASDGFVTTDDIANMTYAYIWALSSGDYVGNASTSFSLGQIVQGEETIYYGISRAFLYFDTSELSGATIQSATLSLYGRVDDTTVDFNITIQDGQPNYPHDPLQLGDYAKGNYSGNGGQFDTTGFTTSGYNSIILNDAGISYINKKGTTKLCLRSDRDIAGTEVMLDNPEYVLTWSNEKGEGYKPKLTITYTLPPSTTMINILAPFLPLFAIGAAVGFIGLFFSIAAPEELRSEQFMFVSLITFISCGVCLVLLVVLNAMGV